jgi:flagellar protein FlaG
MKVESVNFGGGAQAAQQNVADKVSEVRKKKEEPAPEPQAAAKNEVPPEELLKQIKGLAEDGVYSVRFENDETVGDLVVKIVDRETDEVIRQVPAEEVLELRATLEDLRGNLVNTKS